jgi:hypothetical protein
LKIKIPEDLKRKMDELGVDWSPAIRRMIEKEIQNLTGKRCLRAWRESQQIYCREVQEACYW